ncbi:hypothetical protein LCGC14_0434020 [marine sediment metagenome]|uniref:Uncharacterized protein n=1 Tax=marine sediment metagenome TaxID=412755 RepID=A0A0F9T573_9ZZZZ
MSETITIKTSSNDCLNQISVQEVVEYYLKAQQYELLDELIDALEMPGRKYILNALINERLMNEEAIKALGGIDQILEDHPGAVQDHVANTNASQEESAREY